MNDLDKNSRVNKYEKRRKNTKAISFLLILGAILIIILLGIWLFGGSGDDTSQSNGHAETDDSESGTNDSETNDDSDDGQDDADNSDDANNDDSKNDDSDDSIPSEDVDLEEIDNPDDDNVTKAYEGDWDPVETSQSEPHETQYDQESKDWEEMEEAIQYATGLDDDMTVHLIENGGDEQKAVGTVSDSEKENIYRVPIEWQTDEGWKPTKVEILEEVDVD